MIIIVNVYVPAHIMLSYCLKMRVPVINHFLNLAHSDVSRVHRMHSQSHGIKYIMFQLASTKTQQTSVVILLLILLRVAILKTR